MNQSSRTLAFRVIGAAIALNAFAGIVILLGSGSLSETEERIIFTVATLSLLSVGLLPAAIAWGRVRIEDLPVLPAISGSSLILAASMLLAAIWFDIEGDNGGDEAVWTLLIFGLATAHVCLLSLARESELRWIATALTTVLAAIFLYALWNDDEPDWRLTGITAILWFATSLLVPIRQWATGSPAFVAADGSYGPVRYCPYCGERVADSTDVMSCSNCGAAFQITAMAPAEAASGSKPADQQD